MDTKEYKPDESVSGFAELANFREGWAGSESAPNEETSQSSALNLLDAAKEGKAKTEREATELFSEDELEEQSLGGPAGMTESEAAGLAEDTLEESAAPEEQEAQPVQSENLPYIVSDALSDNQVMQKVNRRIFGDVQVADAVQRHLNGEALGDYIPVEEVSRLMKKTGLSQYEVGQYLVGLQEGDVMVSLRGQLGATKMDFLEDAYEELQRRENMGIVGKVRTDVADAFTTGDIVQGLAAGQARFATDLSNLGAGFEAVPVTKNWLTNFQKAIDSAPGVPGLSAAAEFLEITTTKVKVSPQSEEEIARLREVLPEYSQNNKGLEVLKPGKSRWLSLNPRELEAFNEAFGYEGYESHMASMKEQEDQYMAQVDTVTGNVTAMISEYASAYIVSPDFTKRASTAGKIVNGLLKGAVADRMVYNEGDQNVSAFIVETGLPGSQVLEWLATAEGDDEELLNQFKVIAEGAIIGGAVESVGLTFLAFKHAAKGNAKKATTKLAEAAEAEAKEGALKADAYLNDLEATTAKQGETSEKLEGTKFEQAKRDLKAGFEQNGKTEKLSMTIFDSDKLPDLDDLDVELLDGLQAYTRTAGKASVNAPVLKAIFGENWLNNYQVGKETSVGRIFTEDADEVFDMTATKMLKLFDRIQDKDPRSMMQLRGMAYRVLQDVDPDILNPKTLDEVKNTDPMYWSSNAAANILAAGSLQTTYVEEIARLSADIASSNATYQSMDASARATLNKKVMRLDALQGQVALLHGGKAKLARNASHALLAMKELKSVEHQRLAAKATADWEKSQGLINAIQYAQRVQSAMSIATTKSAQAKAISKLSTQTDFWEKLLHVTNAGLLIGPATQQLVVGSSLVRMALLRPMLDFIEGAVVNPVEALLGRSDGWEAAGKSLQRAWHSWGMLYNAVPEGMEAFGKFWKTGKSKFGNSSMFDDRGYFAGKSLGKVYGEEMGKSFKKGELLDAAVALHEPVYRWMGSVDEMFKQLVISMEMGVRARTGDYGATLKTLAAKQRITNADLTQYLKSSGLDYMEIQKSGGIVDKHAMEAALRVTFQQDAAEGSLNQGLRDWLNKRAVGSLISRFFLFRFVSTPLNVMEDRTAIILSAPLLAANTLSGGRIAPGKMLVGKFAADLKAVRPGTDIPDMRVRSKARAVLAANSIFMGLGIMHYNGLRSRQDQEDLVDLNPNSPTYGQFRVKLPWDNGKTRWVNTMDVELPYLNAYVLGQMGADILAKSSDPERAGGLLDAIGAYSALMINESLEKVSIGNATDTLVAIMDDDNKGAAGVIANQLASVVPGNAYAKLYSEMTNGGKFNGRPINMLEAIAKQNGYIDVFWDAANSERDGIGRKQPGHSRGWTPFFSRAFTEDAIFKEFSEIKYSTGTDFTSATFERDDVDLRKLIPEGSNASLFEMMQESIEAGEVTIDGKTLEQAMNDLITSKSYLRDKAKWSEAMARDGFVNGQKRIDHGGEDMKDPRVRRIKNLIKAYRDKAYLHVYRSASVEQKQGIQDAMEMGEFSPETRLYLGRKFGF